MVTSYKKEKQSRRFKFQEDRETLRYRLNDLVKLAEWGLYGLILVIILLVGIFLCLIIR